MNMKKNKDIDLEIGSQITSDYLKQFYPEPKTNMTWIYNLKFNFQGIDVKAELKMEIFSIENKNVNIKVSIGNNSFEESVPIDDFSPIPSTEGIKNSSTSFVYEGKEEVDVPFGKYNDSVKISSLSKEGKYYLWLAKNIGPIKFGITTSGVPAYLELESFSS
ncbi:MAG: hypothetical protein KatS3mg068_0600 [Candidatus Sericytochromatia bacterium]|nr:MAG: hypothetical protein KatS3mg068_0600 [Candidatus Sericytochromatia bacterium]